MDQFGSQGKGSGYKKYFQKYMQGSNGAGGYEHFMAVSSSKLGGEKMGGISSLQEGLCCPCVARKCQTRHP